MGSSVGAPGVCAGDFERLGEVVVGAHLEADDAIDVVALGGEHDDRDVVARRAQAPADREAVLAREHEIEHDEVVAHALQLAIHRRGVGGRIDAEALFGEIALEEVAQPQVVVDHQDLLALLHGSHRTARRRRSPIDM